eukprot:COSAG02_NODE_2084_length_9892_cov_47.719085_6_plen_206_part_00
MNAVRLARVDQLEATGVQQPAAGQSQPQQYPAAVTGCTMETSWSQETKLVVAAKMGDVAAIRGLIAAGADPDSTHGRDDTPALCGAAAGSNNKGPAKAAVQVLLESGASVDKPDSFGVTPLMWAAICGNRDCLLLLLQNNASITAKDISGRTAFGAAKKDSSCFAVLEAWAAGTRDPAALESVAAPAPVRHRPFFPRYYPIDPCL